MSKSNSAPHRRPPISVTRRQALSIAAAVTVGNAIQISSIQEAQAFQDVGPAQVKEQRSPGPEETFALLKQGKRIPVIYDTDIGTDVDDTWGLLYLLKCPELDVRLVACDARLGKYRAKVAAKFLTACGRADIPIAMSSNGKEGLSHQQDWVADYSLDTYSGEVYEDAADQIIKTINASEDPVTLICVGAVPNIAEALRRDPGICKKARFVGMHGSFRIGYGGAKKAVAEANVKTDPKSLQEVLAAPWSCSITPLDTCGLLDLEGDQYQKIRSSKAIGIEPLMENYDAWLKRVDWFEVKPDATQRSSTLFDLVAIYMAFSEDLLAMETLNVDVTEAGMTVEAVGSPEVRCAMNWRSLDAFKEHLVTRLCGEIVPPVATTASQATSPAENQPTPSAGSPKSD